MESTAHTDRPLHKITPILLNRELTWLAFNQRVLAEAKKTSNPLLERLKFLAIVNSNLDEFFMKRIGGLKQQVGAGLNTPSADGRMPQEQIDDCYALINQLDSDISQVYQQLLAELEKENIFITSFSKLDKAEQKQMREYFYKNIYPLLTPQAMDPAHPFPFVSNLSLNLLITLSHPAEKEDYPNVLARLKVPVGQGSRRFIRVSTDSDTFIPLEDLIIHNMDIVFPQMDIVSVEIFRVTRNAVTEKDEERAEDLLELIESELRERRLAPIVRMQFSKGMDSVHKGMLSAELHLDENKDVFEVDGLMSKRDLMELMSINRPDLKDIPHQPADNASLTNENNIFHAIRRSGPFLIQLPYESFSTSVERFLRDASRDPKKTHAKLIHVLRQDYDGLRRYAHIGTGNYHSGTARLYSDLGILTSDTDIGADLTELFNYLTTGYTPKRNYKKILPAPRHMKKGLLDRIKREIEHAKAGKKALIQLKTNALEDVDITLALYKASQAGVKVDLIVRDTCRLVAGVGGLSENIRVISIVGRFLEHARIYYFRNDGDEEYYIGSADLMTRNLVSRVEVIVPIDTPVLQEQLRRFLDMQLADTENAWEMQSNGEYLACQTQTDTDKQSDKKTLTAQSRFIDDANARYKAANRLRLRKTRSLK